jgi:hypothetical protein
MHLKSKKLGPGKKVETAFFGAILISVKEAKTVKIFHYLVPAQKKEQKM